MKRRPFLMVVFVYDRITGEMVCDYENVKEVIRTTVGDDEQLYIECENGYAANINCRAYKIKIICA